MSQKWVERKNCTTLKVYEGSLKAWGYLQNVILRCFRTYRPYHFTCSPLPPFPSHPLLCIHPRKLYLSWFAEVCQCLCLAKQWMHGSPKNESPTISYDWNSTEFRSPRNSQDLPKKQRKIQPRGMAKYRVVKRSWHLRSIFLFSTDALLDPPPKQFWEFTA